MHVRIFTIRSPRSVLKPCGRYLKNLFTDAMKVLACVVLAVLLVVVSAADEPQKDKRYVVGTSLGYSGIPALGYSGLGYSGLGYSGLGYSGLGYSGLGYPGYGYGLGYSSSYPYGYKTY